MRRRTFNWYEYAFALPVIVCINFMMPRLMPGDPFIAMEDDLDQPYAASLTEEQIRYFRRYYDLDQPLPRQFAGYFMKMLRGDMGLSIMNKEPVRSMIFARLPWTFSMVLSSMLLGCLAGSLLGCISALHRKGRLDHVLYTAMVALSEIPSFIVGIGLLLLFAVKIRWFPLSGGITPFIAHDNALDWIADWLHHAVLPVIALSFARVCGFYMMTRNSMMTVLSRDYIRTARAKGIGWQGVVFGHALRNAALPIATHLFLGMGGLFGGAVLVENVFAYPGLGSLMGSAVASRDYILLQGVFLFMSVTVLTMNALAELVYRKLDPRLCA